MRHNKRVLASFAFLGLALAACAENAVATTTTQAPSTTTAAPAATSSSASVEEIEVTFVDYAFQGLPETVPVGTRLTVVNESETEIHELVAFRLADGEERNAAELASLPPEEMGPALGPPVTVLISAPGGTQINEVGDGVLSEPGRYAIFCFIPTGVDPQVYVDALATSDGPPQIEGAGPPHFVNGMLADLTVEG